MKLEIIKKTGDSSRNQSILFIHGMYHGAWCYEEYFMSYFSNLGYECYALSFRNHGKSGQKNAMWKNRISHYVSDLKQAVNEIGNNPVLVGHSMGGFVIQKYLENNEAIASVLLASVPPKGILGTTMRVLKKYPIPFLKLNLTWNLYHLISNPKIAQNLFLSPDLSSEKLTEYHKKLDNESMLAYLDMMLFNLPKTKRITPGNMLILGAEKDVVNKLDDVKNIAKSYNKPYKIISNTTHDMMLDPNWKLTAKEISSWLDKEVFFLC